MTCFRKITAVLPLPALIIAGLASGIAPLSSAAAEKSRRPVLSEMGVARFSAPILSLEVAPGSDLAAVALTDGHVRVWHIDTGELVHEFRFTEPETDQRQKDQGEVEPIRVRFTPDGKSLGISHLSRVHLYKVGTWSELRTLGVEGEDVMRPVPQPELSQRPLVAKEPDDINSGTRKWAQRKALGDGRTRITDFAFTPDGMATVVSYCRTSCYDMPNGVRWMISNGHEPVRLWDLASGRVLWEHYSDPNRITDRVVLSPDGKSLVEVVFQPGHWDLQVRDVATGRESLSLTLSVMPSEPPDIVFTPNSHSFISLWHEPGKMWQMALFDAASGELLAHFSDVAGAQRVAISPNGLWLAVTTWRGVAFKLWDIAKRRPLITLVPKQAGVRVRSLDVRFTSDGRKLVVSDRQNALVFRYAITG